jgi:hypothetical protein
MEKLLLVMDPVPRPSQTVSNDLPQIKMGEKGRTRLSGNGGDSGGEAAEGCRRGADRREGIMQIAKCKLQIANCKLQIANCKLQNEI